MSARSSTEESKARRKAERRSRMMIKLANRTFNKEPNLLDRVAIRMLTKAVGPPTCDDPDLDHDGPITPFQ